MDSTGATDARRSTPREPPAVRRERVLRRIEVDRGEVAASWHAVTGVVAEREHGAMAVAQGLRTAVRIGGIAAAIWMANRVRGPWLMRRGLVLMTAARSAGRLFNRRRRARG